MAVATRTAAAVSGAAFRSGIRSGMPRAVDVSAKAQTAPGVMSDVRTLINSEDRDWPGKAEFERGCEESSRLLIANGYATDEAVMEMVAEEIRAYRRETAARETLADK